MHLVMRNHVEFALVMFTGDTYTNGCWNVQITCTPGGKRHTNRGLLTSAIISSASSLRMQLLSGKCVGVNYVASRGGSSLMSGHYDTILFDTRSFSFSGS